MHFASKTKAIFRSGALHSKDKTLSNNYIAATLLLKSSMGEFWEMQ